MAGVRIAILVLAAAGCAAAAQPAEMTAFAGGYGKAIYALHFSPATGRLVRVGVAAETPNPSYLAVSADGRFLYAANEVGAANDTVSAFAVDARGGKLLALNQVSSRGSAPCHLAIDKTGKWLAVANYASGSIAVLPILADGKLGEAAAVDRHQGSSVNAARQKGPHAHSVVFSPDNRFLLSADLGVDKVFVYRFDAGSGAIAPAEPAFAAVAPGSGPRHLVFHPSGLAVYVVNELADNVSVFRYDAATGSLNDAQIVDALPVPGSTGAEIAVQPSGAVVYVSNRGRDSITRMAIDAERYLLTPLEATPMLGKTPRFFTFDPSAGFLIVANQDSNNLAVFQVHPRTGELRPLGPLVTGITQPSCLVFGPAQGTKAAPAGSQRR